jgi:hypothetical protein
VSNRSHTWLCPARADARMWAFGIVVLVLIVSWWVYIFKLRDNHRPGADNRTEVPPIVTGDPNGPQISFPDAVRSDNPQINKFVVDFVNILLNNDYKAYRLMVTQRREPINFKTFDEAYGRVKSIDIRKIEKIDNKKAIKQMKLTDISLPVYRIKVHVALRDKSEQDVDLFVFKEEGRWVSSR